jgi:hypothetical protein
MSKSYGCLSVEESGGVVGKVTLENFSFEDEHKPGLELRPMKPNPHVDLKSLGELSGAPKGFKGKGGEGLDGVAQRSPASRWDLGHYNARVAQDRAVIVIMMRELQTMVSRMPNSPLSMVCLQRRYRGDKHEINLLRWRERLARVDVNRERFDVIVSEQPAELAAWIRMIDSNAQVLMQFEMMLVANRSVMHKLSMMTVGDDAIRTCINELAQKIGVSSVLLQSLVVMGEEATCDPLER